MTMGNRKYATKWGVVSSSTDNGLERVQFWKIKEVTYLEVKIGENEKQNNEIQERIARVGRNEEVRNVETTNGIHVWS